MTKAEIQAILAAHSLYLDGEAGGKRADLRSADLRSADLGGANLWSADLGGANLWSADLRSANLGGANLRSANLWSANLRSADLRSADLSYADLRSANLRSADLRSANLRSADLEGADLGGADLSYADLSGTRLPHFQLPPSEGAFTAWKKAGGGRVLKLQIPAGAERTSSLVGRKCRASHVITLEIIDSNPGETSITGHRDLRTAYTVGEVTKADSYDPDIRVECTHGIHFFMTRKEAEEY